MLFQIVQYLKMPIADNLAIAEEAFTNDFDADWAIAIFDDSASVLVTSVEVSEPISAAVEASSAHASAGIVPPGGRVVA